MKRPPPRSSLFPYTTLFRSPHRPPTHRIKVQSSSYKFKVGLVLNRPLTRRPWPRPCERARRCAAKVVGSKAGDRKSTRLNSSHSQISYAVFCLKTKKDDTCS